MQPGAALTLLDLTPAMITMEHIIIGFLRAHLSDHWDHLGRTQLNQPALAFLALMEKAERGQPP